MTHEVTTNALDMNGELPAHLSVELGHFYPDDLAQGPKWLEAQFRKIVAFGLTAINAYTDGITEPRISTCLMIDDYRKGRDVTPQEVIGDLVLPAAEAAGLRVDYVAREAGFALIAQKFLRRLGDMPVAYYGDSLQPPAWESGWLSNGSAPQAEGGGEAMKATKLVGGQLRREGTLPHEESYFRNVQLFNRENGETVWSCPLLASIWQAARLGLLAEFDQSVVTPRLAEVGSNHDRQFGDDWDALPAITKLEADAHPFEAYRTWSVLPWDYKYVESAVCCILERVDAVASDERMRQLAGAEGIRLRQPYDRIGYAFGIADTL